MGIILTVVFMAQPCLESLMTLRSSWSFYHCRCDRPIIFATNRWSTILSNLRSHEGITAMCDKNEKKCKVQFCEPVFQTRDIF